MSYTTKYKIIKGPVRKNRWKLGPDTDMITLDKYYGLMKHQAQAKYRGESHSLTWEEWSQLWPTEQWLQRGKSKHNLCLMQIDREGGWHMHNVEVVERMTYLARAQEYRTTGT